MSRKTGRLLKSFTYFSRATVLDDERSRYSNVHGEKVIVYCDEKIFKEGPVLPLRKGSC